MSSVSRCCEVLASDDSVGSSEPLVVAAVALQGGITTADRIVTVSPGYSEEIRTFLGGWGLEGMLNDRGPVLTGIVNGIDEE